MRAPAIAVADGARGFWLALREVFPETRSQRCWVHKRANVLGKIPRKKQDLFKQRLDEFAAAETRAEALGLIGWFEAAHGATYPRAVKSLTDGIDELLAYFDFPADHWRHLRTTNPIEVQLRGGAVEEAAATDGVVDEGQGTQHLEGPRIVDAAQRRRRRTNRLSSRQRAPGLSQWRER